VVPATGGLTISTLKTTKYGTILVSGKTVYVLKPSTVACAAACIKIWPQVLLPVGVTHATAGKGVTATKLGVIKRANGRLQVTYASRPLYWYVGDKLAGQVRGNLTDIWGKWTVYVTVKPVTPPPTTTTTTGGGGIGF
jgi:predicted lipoprotein with Yx(FWY)xxD motif